MVDERNVPEGYKVTEAGIIPEDWEFLRIGDLGNFSKGAGIRKDQANSGHIPCVRYGELYTKHNDIIRNYYSFISRDIAETSRKLKTGDVLFAGSGETKEEIGKCAAFIDETEVYAGGDIIIFSPSKGISEFYGYLLNAPFSIKQKASKGQGDAIVHISSSSLANIVIPFPTETEQKSIAEALSDTDNLIQSVEKLIDKKKKIKQGALQQLLTGKRRLPGFSGEWEVKKLGTLIEFYNGKAHEDAITKIGKYVVANSKFISTEGDVVKYSNQQLCPALKKDVLMVMSDVPNGRAIAKCYYVGNDDQITVNQRICILRSKLVVSKFLFYILDRNPYYLSFDDGVKQTNLRKEDVLNCDLKLPPSKEEQKAIAQVLSDMDLEIEALEEKLEKYKTIKQGMMQELLTGRIRLI